LVVGTKGGVIDLLPMRRNNPEKQLAMVAPKPRHPFNAGQKRRFSGKIPKTDIPLTWL
jgi:hypothetical protein